MSRLSKVRVGLPPTRYMISSISSSTRRRLASTHALVFLEHSNGVIESVSLSALTAATHLGQDAQITGVVVGTKEEVEKVLPNVQKLPGLTSVLHSSSKHYSPPLPETVAPLFHSLLSSKNKYTHLLSAHSSSAKSILPRVAATLDLPQVSDITSLSHSSSTNETTFTRPIYAGNAIATVKAGSDIPLKIITVRGTAFPASSTTSSSSSNNVSIEELPAIEEHTNLTTHLSTELTTSDRPDLNTAKTIVSGGRALKNKETFDNTLDPLAQVLNAALGASRAAVDAGYAENSLQIGQTGKIVAPELYIAIGISGAIQHLAGMKDSKMIVAINKDPDAPIFQVADVGIVGDLFEVVPQLVEKLKQ